MLITFQLDSLFFAASGLMMTLIAIRIAMIQWCNRSERRERFSRRRRRVKSTSGKRELNENPKASLALPKIQSFGRKLRKQRKRYSRQHQYHSKERFESWMFPSEALDANDKILDYLRTTLTNTIDRLEVDIYTQFEQCPLSLHEKGLRFRLFLDMKQSDL